MVSLNTLRNRTARDSRQTEMPMMVDPVTRMNKIPKKLNETCALLITLYYMRPGR